jgi:uncharacterized protein (DUF488 family)
MEILTIGHSNHALGMFIQLLKAINIEVLVDIRSNPYSRFTPQFNKDNLKKAIQASGMKYLFLGKELGGRPYQTILDPSPADPRIAHPPKRL